MLYFSFDSNYFLGPFKFFSEASINDTGFFELLFLEFLNFSICLLFLEQNYVYLSNLFVSIIFRYGAKKREDCWKKKMFIIWK